MLKTVISDEGKNIKRMSHIVSILGELDGLGKFLHGGTAERRLQEEKTFKLKVSFFENSDDDFQLLELRLKVCLCSMDLFRAFFEEQLEKKDSKESPSIIVLGLEDKTSRAIQNCSTEFAACLKLYERYPSKSMIDKFSALNNLINGLYDQKTEMIDHVTHLEPQCPRQTSVSYIVEDSMRVLILLSSLVGAMVCIRNGFREYNGKRSGHMEVCNTEFHRKSS